MEIKQEAKRSIDNQIQRSMPLHDLPMDQKWESESYIHHKEERPAHHRRIDDWSGFAKTPLSDFVVERRFFLPKREERSPPLDHSPSASSPKVISRSRREGSCFLSPLVIAFGFFTEVDKPIEKRRVLLSIFHLRLFSPKVRSLHLQLLHQRWEAYTVFGDHRKKGLLLSHYSPSIKRLAKGLASRRRVLFFNVSLSMKRKQVFFLNQKPLLLIGSKRAKVLPWTLFSFLPTILKKL